jgi:hypothetical protein
MTEALTVVARVRAGEGGCRPGGHPPLLGDRRPQPVRGRAGDAPGALQVLHPPRRRWRRGPADYMLLAADDPPLGGWLAALCAHAGPAVDAVLAHCARYPGAADPAAFVRWIAANRLHVGFSVVADARSTVPETAAALACTAGWARSPSGRRAWAPATSRGLARGVRRVTRLDRADIQGNVLRGYGFAAARYLFAEVRQAGPACAWLAALEVTSEQRKHPVPTLNVELTHAGLRMLGVPPHVLASFPEGLRDGMAARAALLGDDRSPPSAARGARRSAARACPSPGARGTGGPAPPDVPGAPTPLGRLA